MKTRISDEILKHLPILGLILIIAGNIKIFLYYKIFNLEIFPFIDLDEILILFMQNSVSYLVLLTACILSVVIFSLNNHDIPSDSRIKRLAKYLLNKYLFLLFVTFSILSIVFNWIRPNSNFFEVWLLIGAFFITTYCVPILIQEIWFGLNLKKGSLVTVVLILVFISINIFSAASAFNEANKTRKGYFNKVEIVFDDFTFKSTSSCYYIGQTKNYVFIFNSCNASVTSYPISRIRSIKF